MLIAFGRVEAREEFAERIRAQLRSWAREAAPLEPFPCGFVFQEIRALVNEVEAELHRDSRPRKRVRNKKRARILARDNYTCRECGFNSATPHRDTLTIDHIVPVCEGGSNADENLQTLCQRCNTEKGRALLPLATVA
jgi:hypothetical protein